MNINPCGKSPVISIPGNAFRVNFTYFVDPTYGDDSTGQIDEPTRPFRTIQAPSLVAVPNSVIVVRPGTYSEGIINLRPNVAWYFEPSATLVDTYFFGNQPAAILGYGRFINAGPALNYNGTGDMTFMAEHIESNYAGYAFSIRGQGKTTIQVESVIGNLLETSDVPVDVTIVVLTHAGDRSITINSSSSGHVLANIADSTVNVSGLNIRSNNIDFMYEGQSIVSTGEYYIDVLDDEFASRSFINFNFVIDRLECFGFIRSTGIPNVSDVLLQPSINLHASTIESVNNLSTRPIIDMQYTFCNLIYSRLSFSYFVPIPYIIELSGITVLTVNGSQTLNSSQIGTASVGFLRSNGNNSAGVVVANLNLSELFVTSSVISNNGFSIVYLSVINFTNIIPNPGEISIVNYARMGLFIRNGLIQYPDGGQFIVNSNELFVAGDSLEINSNNSVFISNNNRMQTRIGRIASAGSGNTYVQSSGLSGFTIGSLLLLGQNNIGLQVANGRATTQIGQIDGQNQTGNVGIDISGESQLLGSIIAIRMLDSPCLRMSTSSSAAVSDVKFSTMSINMGSSIVDISGTSSIILDGDSMRAQNATSCINLLNQGTVQIVLDQFLVTECGIGVNVAGGPDCRCWLSINNFNISNQAGSAGISIDDSILNMDGNYTLITPGNQAPLIRILGSNAELYANLGFVTSTFNNLAIESFESIWYSSKRSQTLDINGRNVEANISAPLSGTSNLTLEGPFFTQGDTNFLFVGGVNPDITRVLNPYLVSTGRSIDAGANPLLTFFCNYGVANRPLSGAIENPIGSFVVAAIQ